MPDTAALAARLLDALPQTQCQRCGYPDCASYAQAIAMGQAAINQCPPGGDEGVVRLASITGQAVQPLNPEFGQVQERSMAFIDEDWCIGCTLCVQACPVDAIIGGNKAMHTIDEAHCTGCELCVPACPVDCIEIELVTPGRTGWQAWSPEQAAAARQRYADHQQRQAADTARASLMRQAAFEALQAPVEVTVPVVAAASRSDETADKKAAIAAALARARAQRNKA